MNCRNITQIDKWSSDSIRTLCIKERWYTRGDNRDYCALLNFVGRTAPEVENIKTVAEDICGHSKDLDCTKKEDIESVMFMIRRYAVDTFYEI